MYSFYSYRNWKVYSSFIIAILLQSIPFFVKTWFFQPSWIMMMLIYWNIKFPEKVNIGTGFFLGLIEDCMFHSTIGVHSIFLSALSYLTIRKIIFFRTTTIWWQSCCILFFSLIHQSIIFFLNYGLLKFYIHLIFF